jgi:hypothetical protein
VLVRNIILEAALENLYAPWLIQWVPTFCE